MRDEEFGGEIVKPGIFISDGIDNKGDINAADKNLGSEKSYKENHGERAGRGKVPPGTRIVHDTGRVSDNRAARLLFRAREKNLEKRLKKENKTPANQFTPTRTRELRKIIDEGGDILFQTGFPHARGGVSLKNTASIYSHDAMFRDLILLQAFVQRFPNSLRSVMNIIINKLLLGSGRRHGKHRSLIADFPRFRDYKVILCVI